MSSDSKDSDGAKVVDVSKELVDGLKDRLNSPLLFTFLLLSASYNWKAVLYVAFSEDKVLSKIAAITEDTFDLTTSYPFMLPALMTIGFHIAYPFVQQIVIQWNAFARAVVQTLLSYFDRLLARLRIKTAEAQRKALLAEALSTEESLAAESNMLIEKTNQKRDDIRKLEAELAKSERELQAKQGERKIAEGLAVGNVSPAVSSTIGSILATKPPLSLAEHAVLSELLMKGLVGDLREGVAEVLHDRFARENLPFTSIKKRMKGNLDAELRALVSKVVDSDEVTRMGDEMEELLAGEQDVPTLRAYIEAHSLSSGVAESLGNHISKQSNLNKEQKEALLKLILSQPYLDATAIGNLQ